MKCTLRHVALAGALGGAALGIPTQAMQERTPVDVAALGPRIGELVPDFSLPDQNGRVRTRDSILGPNGAILLFHRSADW